MKANELRIGNIVISTDMDGNTVYGCVRTLRKNDLSIENEVDGVGNVYVVYDFTPIPLTEDWLLKFGFKRSSYNDSRYDFGEWHIIFSKNDKPVFRVVGRSIVYCEYLHTLQNLIFALTGEELTINENA